MHLLIEIVNIPLAYAWLVGLRTLGQHLTNRCDNLEPMRKITLSQQYCPQNANIDQTNDCYLGCYNIFKNNVITISLLMWVPCVLKMKRFHILIKGDCYFGEMVKRLPCMQKVGCSNFVCVHGAEWGRTFRVFFRVSRLSVHSDGLFVLPKEINQVGV